MKRSDSYHKVTDGQIGSDLGVNGAFHFLSMFFNFGFGLDHLAGGGDL